MRIEGRNTIEEALRAGFNFDKLLVQKGLKDAHSQRIIDMAKQSGAKITFYDKAIMDKQTTARHQGFIAEISDYKYFSLEEIISSDENPFILLLDGLEDPHNLGNILRTAECCGVSGVVIPARRSVAVNETVIKVSAGAAAHVKIARVNNINEAIDTLKENNIWVYCAETGGQPMYNVDLTGRTAIVIGGEGKGAGERTKKNCDGIISIPMLGKLNSLNASVAGAIVMYERIRQNINKK